MEKENSRSLFRKAKKKLGITTSSFVKSFKEICKSVLVSNEEEEILIAQVELITEHLRSIWKSKENNSNFKHPNVEQLRYELNFNKLFLEGKFLEALDYKVNSDEIYIHTEQNRIKRIYEIKTTHTLLKKALKFYDLLIFLGIEKTNLWMNDIWEEYCIVKNIPKESSKKRIFKLIRLLEKKLLILRLKDKEGRVMVVRHSYSQKT